MERLDIPALRAVAFDLDGLMVNTEDIYDRVLEDFLVARGHRFSRELKQAIMGLTPADAHAALKSRVPLRESPEELQRLVVQAFEAQLGPMLRPMPGITEILSWLDRYAIPRAVVTSSPRRLAYRVLDVAGLNNGFQFVLTGDDITRGKPAPDIYLQAARQFDISPDELLVLEDSPNGSRAAASAGAFTIAVPTIHCRGLDYSHVPVVASRLDDELVARVLDSAFASFRKATAAG